MKYTYKYRLERPVAKSDLLNFIKEELQERNFIIKKINPFLYYFSIKGLPRITDYSSNKFYNLFFRDGTFYVSLIKSQMKITWSISNSYVIMYSSAVFIGVFGLVSIYDSILAGFLIGFFSSIVFAFIIYGNIVSWLKRLSNSVLDKYL